MKAPHNHSAALWFNNTQFYARSNPPLTWLLCQIPQKHRGMKITKKEDHYYIVFKTGENCYTTREYCTDIINDLFKLYYYLTGS